MADPPWYFRNFSAKGEGRNAISHYECMSVEDIGKLPIAEHAARDCALYLWVTDPFLPRAFELIDAWGFEFKTVAFYWAKLNKRADAANLTEASFFTGLGYWTRANVEQCLLATRGKPARQANDVKRLIVDHRREHSRKPEEAYTRVKRLTKGPYLDLFAREPRLGWSAWGDQLDLFKGGPIRTRRRSSR